LELSFPIKDLVHGNMDQSMTHATEPDRGSRHFPGCHKIILRDPPIFQTRAALVSVVQAIGLACREPLCCAVMETEICQLSPNTAPSSSQA
jgi:hypothetical protein